MTGAEDNRCFENCLKLTPSQMAETGQIIVDALVTQLSNYKHGAKLILHLFDQRRTDLKPIYLGRKIEEMIMAMNQLMMQH